MILIVGLGNPGPAYQNTRHNFGFEVIDSLGEKYDAEFKFKIRFNAELAEIKLKDQKLILAKPSTFMNKSGEAVLSIASFYKLTPAEIIVVMDDIDLPLGRLKLLKNGGPGTHNGMKSIVSKIGKNFTRLRLGIESRGAMSPLEQDTASFVLEKFNKEEQKIAKNTIKTACEALETLIISGVDNAMNTFN